MKIHAWCDKFELRDFLKERKTPHFYRQPFWHGDGSPSVRVTITWNKKTALLRDMARRPAPEDARGQK